MIRKTTERNSLDLVSELRREQSRWEAAIRCDDDLAVEQAAEHGDALLNALVISEEGRTALENMLSDDSPGLRLGVAAKVVNWAPDKAIPILARLLYEDFDPVVAPWEGAGVRMNARLLLMEYFGLDEPMPLPIRLADMGLQLPKWLSRELSRE
jgi:hypothetical protein